jgi:uncharacterized protein YceK
MRRLPIISLLLAGCSTVAGRAVAAPTATELQAAMVRSLPAGQGGNCTPPRNISCEAAASNTYFCTYELSYSPNRWQSASGTVTLDAGSWTFKGGQLSCNFHSN